MAGVERQRAPSKAPLSQITARSTIALKLTIAIPAVHGTAEPTDAPRQRTNKQQSGIKQHVERSQRGYRNRRALLEEASIFTYLHCLASHDAALQLFDEVR